MVAKVEDAIDESAAAADSTMPKVEAPAPASVDVPAAEVSADAAVPKADVPPTPAVGGDVEAAVDGVIGKAPGMPSAEVSSSRGTFLHCCCCCWCCCYCLFLMIDLS